jgi:hypothetical protein
MSNKKVTKALVDDKYTEIAGIKLHKITASSFTLCEFLNLGLISGKESQHPQFELLTFMWIHAVGAKSARDIIFQASETDSTGRSLSLVTAVMDWADDIQLKDFNQIAVGIGDMLNDSFENAMVPDEGAEVGKK